MKNFSKLIYELMNGYLRTEDVPPALRQAVSNEFTEDRPCEKWCSDIYTARLRLGKRLHTDEEDRDILAIINAYESMTQYLSEKMYEYGKANLELLEDPKSCITFFNAWNRKSSTV